ncbi:MAG TPA: RagB/SusD family nutrient uptake outer membrane protein, partial [Bacteroidales bacterium]|nr:RagB/SusD family nutrient uptake outer membrane protein [Bacteroidales bacterium]
MKRFIVFFITAVLMVSCEFLDPRPIQDLSTDELLSNAEYGEGLLIGAYMNMNTDYLDYSDYYTDNAVPSVPGGNRIALGNWTVQNNPVGEWDRWYETIGFLNRYLRDCKDLLFSVSDPTLNKILQKNRRGEAFFMRAWYEWLLLQTYGGYPEGGATALGFPIVTRVLTADDVLDLPRNTYEECVAQIAKDCDSAIVLLPKWYSGTSSWDNLSNRGRADAMSAWTLKSRVYLYAASPAYSESTPELWQRAAQVAHDAMVFYGGNNLHTLDRIATDGTSLNNIFIQPSYSSNDWEYAFYPPSLYGGGQCNPSQNLVDEFPAKDGYPISVSTLFDPANPYANRDPRLSRFIFYNGMNYNGTTIQTFTGGSDAPGGLSLQGTRTGYYLKKFLNPNVRLTPGDVTTSIRFKVFLSKTELYLN